MNEVKLTGCCPTPLASYLKSLGIFRILAEQIDPDIKGYWQSDTFILLSRLTNQEVVIFFLDSYQPSSIIAPWNGGSGFFPNDNKTGIDALSASDAERFRKLRLAIETARCVLGAASITEKPDSEQKLGLLQRLRCELDDHALLWLDAAVLLTEENPRYPPLLGTGGNDGRLDFTNNYMQRLVELFEAASGKAAPEAFSLLNSALFAVSTTGLKSSAIGQFSPGAAGGPNATTGFDADSLINPWDFILMLEGAVLFAAAATRRLESAEPGVMSYPFTVRATGSGEGNTALNDEGNARAEIWLPLWNMPTGLEEIKSLLSEGRVTLDRKPIRDGLDFMRAISRLGIERGIEAFQRYAFVMRSGKAYLATPLARVSVSGNTASRLIDQLDSRENNNWLYRFRKLARTKESPARIQSLVRKLEDALFELARFDEPKYVQQVLILLGQVQNYFSASPAGREKCFPVPVLTEEWANKANDGSFEFQIARALAVIHAKAMVNGKSQTVMFMSEHFAPIQESYKFRKWDEEAHHNVVWGRNALEDNLYAVLQRRLLNAERNSLPDKPLAGTASAPLSAITAWFNGEADPRRITDLLAGLVLIRLPFSLADDSYDYPLPAAYTLLKPFFCTDEQLHKTELLPKEAGLPLSRELVMRIWRNDSGVLDWAKRRLKAAACPLQGEHIRYEGSNGRALLAALMIPISNKSLQKLTDPLRTKQQPATETIIE